MNRAQPGCYAYGIQLSEKPGSDSFRLDFLLGSEDVLLCLSSGFAPAPSVEILERLSEVQERLLLRDRQLTLTMEGRQLQLRHYPRALLAAQPQTCIELSVPQSMALPLRVQLWSYAPQEKRAAPNLPENAVCLPVSLSYSVSRCWLTGASKVYVSRIRPQDFPDGFLCYYVGKYEYPIPNALLDKPFRLELKDVSIQAASPWRDCIKLVRE